MLPDPIHGELEGKERTYYGGQVAKSPDHNPLDLGTFKPMNDRIANEPDGLYAELRVAVDKVWGDIPPRMLHDIIRLLPMTIRETIRMHGGNHYKIPHKYPDDLEPLLKDVGPTEKNWVDKDVHGRDAVWLEHPDGLVGYEKIESVWPGEHCDSDEEPPDIMHDLSIAREEADGPQSAGVTCTLASTRLQPSEGTDSECSSEDDLSEDSDTEDDSE